jgi:1,4-alpha-glucan branching enzyme
MATPVADWQATTTEDAVITIKSANKKSAPKKKVTVVFALRATDTDQPVSVVGDFNGWDPLANPLEPRRDGSQRTRVKVPVGASYHFKYLAGDGSWFCDPDVDEREPNEFGEMNSVLNLT